MNRMKSKISRLANKTLKICKSKQGAIFVGVGIKIIIAVVIGALMLGGTYALTRDNVVENTSNKVKDLFDYDAQAVNPSPVSDSSDVISFTIDGVGTFQAEDGMTWGDWILSYQISSGDNGIVWVQPDTLELYVDVGNGLWINYIKNQTYGDVLIEGMTYEVGGPT